MICDALSQLMSLLNIIETLSEYNVFTNYIYTFSFQHCKTFSIDFWKPVTRKNNDFIWY